MYVFSLMRHLACKMPWIIFLKAIYAEKKRVQCRSRPSDAVVLPSLLSTESMSPVFWALLPVRSHLDKILHTTQSKFSMVRPKKIDLLRSTRAEIWVCINACQESQNRVLRDHVIYVEWGLNLMTLGDPTRSFRVSILVGSRVARSSQRNI